MTRRRYLDDEYEEKIAEFVANHEGITREAAEERFRRACEELRSVLRDDAPDEALRRLAFHKLQWDPPGEGDGAV